MKRPGARLLRSRASGQRMLRRHGYSSYVTMDLVHNPQTLEMYKIGRQTLYIATGSSQITSSITHSARRGRLREVSMNRCKLVHNQRRRDADEQLQPRIQRTSLHKPIHPGRMRIMRIDKAIETISSSERHRMKLTRV